MATRTTGDRATILQGTLDLLILRTLALGRHHGHGVVLAIQHSSNHMLLVDHGSLYPSLQRMETRGWIRGEWGVSDNNRRARFYELTKAGRKQLAKEAIEWRRLAIAVSLVLGTDAVGG
ncbi:MAG TPA: PadR family transcriptional regulator [Gemmatimonadaceae bacterium]|nr:PadR family transcriptional regulator [Gemmatimonadaceae bacterium]